MSDSLETLITIFVSACIFATGLFIGMSIEEKTMKGRAIASKVAEYTMNPTNGETSFQFKTNLIERVKE